MCITPEIPESIRNEAKYLLRHFPTADDIKPL
ncbi:BPSL0761 family protein, partial [Pseudomonas aeruginosa]